MINESNKPERATQGLKYTTHIKVAKIRLLNL